MHTHDRRIDLELQGSVRILTVCALLSNLGLPFACSKCDEIPTGARWEKVVHCQVLYLPRRLLNNWKCRHGHHPVPLRVCSAGGR